MENKIIIWHQGAKLEWCVDILLVQIHPFKIEEHPSHWWGIKKKNWKWGETHNIKRKLINTNTHKHINIEKKKEQWGKERICERVGETYRVGICGRMMKKMDIGELKDKGKKLLNKCVKDTKECVWKRREWERRKHKKLGREEVGEKKGKKKSEGRRGYVSKWE